MGSKDYQRFLEQGTIRRGGKLVPAKDIPGTKAHKEQQKRVDDAIAQHFSKGKKVAVVGKELPRCLCGEVAKFYAREKFYCEECLRGKMKKG